MMHQPTVQQVIAQLVSRGQKPSLALLKARLGHTVPLPQLIQALQQWRQDPQSVQVEPQPGETPEPSEPAVSLEDVMQELRALRQEVAQLRQLIQQR